MAQRIRVAVLCGGRSAERDVSLKTGAQVAAALDAAKYDVSTIDVGDLPALAGAEAEERPEVVFIALHGPGGEDGTVQGFLEFLGIAYTGSGILASALAMDKLRSKAIFSTANVICPPDVVFRREEGPRIRRAGREVGEILDYPVIVKPNRQGSTYGCTIVEDETQVTAAIKNALRYDDTAIVETRLVGTEITVAVLGNDDAIALPIVEIVAKDGFFDYEAKYSTGDSGAIEIVPARIEQADAQEAISLALSCHRLLGCRGMSRTDMFVTEDGVVVLETNTIPGMTATSLLPKAAKAAGIEFPQLLDRLIADALSSSASS